MILNKIWKHRGKKTAWSSINFAVNCDIFAPFFSKGRKIEQISQWTAIFLAINGNNFGVNCEIWLQITNSTPKFTAKIRWVDLRTANYSDILDMRRWHQLRNYVFRIFSSLFRYPSTRPNWGKIGFECENIAVYCKIWAFRAAKFRSPLQIFGIFFCQFQSWPLSFDAWKKSSTWLIQKQSTGQESSE